MKLFGAILAALYAGVMHVSVLYAMGRKNVGGPSSFLILAGSALVGTYVFLSRTQNWGAMPALIAGMLAISAGTLLNGFRQGKLHVHHHMIRLLLETAIVGICWIGL